MASKFSEDFAVSGLYELYEYNVNVTNLKDIPSEVTYTEHFVKPLNYADQHTVCPGIVCNKKVRQLAVSGRWNGIFKDKKGKMGTSDETSLKAQLA